jgi:hypothetical protein
VIGKTSSVVRDTRSKALFENHKGIIKSSIEKLNEMG